ncbi:MAG: hypothetical protein JO124_17510 [Hyphomicrobiales bacterium]|nr:hypothetical protein [Hyphomicrobiales bacterium]
MQRLPRVLWTIVALIFLGLSWLWDHLHPIITFLIRILPLEGLKEVVRHLMQRLPPYPTLIVFLVPAIVHEGMKVVAFFLFRRHQWLAGVLVYFAADVIGVALVAFIFETCKEKLLSIPWFAWCYAWFEKAHIWARAQVAPIKAYIHQALSEAGLIGRRAGVIAKLAALWRYERRRRRTAGAA